MKFSNDSKAREAKALIRQALILLDELPNEKDAACSLQSALDKINNVPAMKNGDVLGDEIIGHFINDGG